LSAAFLVCFFVPVEEVVALAPVVVAFFGFVGFSVAGFDDIIAAAGGPTFKVAAENFGVFGFSIADDGAVLDNVVAVVIVCGGGGGTGVDIGLSFGGFIVVFVVFAGLGAAGSLGSFGSFGSFFGADFFFSPPDADNGGLPRPRGLLGCVVGVGVEGFDDVDAVVAEFAS
jgi:hypothetical protein